MTAWAERLRAILPTLCSLLVVAGCTGSASDSLGTASVPEAASAQSLQFAPRIALVIGNNGYTRWERLHLSANDAVATAQAFRSAGFTLIANGPQIDISAARFQELIAETVASVRAHPGAIVAIYFSGHGFAYQGRNMLVPVDASHVTGSAAALGSVGVAEIAQSVSAAGSSLTMLFLDACREAVDGPGGFADAPPPPRTFIGFGTYFGTWATEGAGPHSNYTTALIESLNDHWDRLGDLHAAIASRVAVATRGEQVPVYRAAPGVAESRAHIAFADPESVYARLARDEPRTQGATYTQALLAARCATFGTTSLLRPPGRSAMHILAQSDPSAPQTVAVEFQSPVSPEDVLVSCREAYAAGARDTATLRGYSTAVFAVSAGHSLSPAQVGEVVLAESLLIQAAEGGDGDAETSLAMMSAGVPSPLGNVPIDHKLAGERLLHAVEVNKSPVGWMVGLSLIKPGMGWDNDAFNLAPNPPRGFRILVESARRYDPMAVEILVSKTPGSFGYSEPLDVRSLIRQALGRGFPAGAIGAVAFSGLTVGQTLYALALLDAVGGPDEPPDLPGFVRLAVVSEPWFARLMLILKNPSWGSSVGCALLGGISSRRPLPFIPRDTQLGRRFLQMSAEMGDSRSQHWLNASMAGNPAPCSMNADVWPQ